MLGNIKELIQCSATWVFLKYPVYDLFQHLFQVQTHLSL